MTERETTATTIADELATCYAGSLRAGLPPEHCDQERSPHGAAMVAESRCRLTSPT